MDQFVQLLGDVGVQPGSRLIQQQHGPGSAQGPGQQHPLLLAAGQGSVTGPGQVLDAQAFQGLLGLIFLLAGVEGAAAQAA